MSGWKTLLRAVFEAFGDLGWWMAPGMADPTALASQDQGLRPGATSLFTRKVRGGLLVKEGDGQR